MVKFAPCRDHVVCCVFVLLVLLPATVAPGFGTNALPAGPPFCSLQAAGPCAAAVTTAVAIGMAARAICATTKSSESTTTKKRSMCHHHHCSCAMLLQLLAAQAPAPRDAATGRPAAATVPARRCPLLAARLGHGCHRSRRRRSIGEASAPRCHRCCHRPALRYCRRRCRCRRRAARLCASIPMGSQ